MYYSIFLNIIYNVGTNITTNTYLIVIMFRPCASLDAEATLFSKKKIHYSVIASSYLVF